MNFFKSIFVLFLTLLMSIAVINCSRSKFSANTATPNSVNNAVLTDDNGIPVGQPFGATTTGTTVYVDANGTHYIIDANGTVIVTDANGNPIATGNPIVGIINIEGRVSPNQVGQTVVINPSSPGAICGQWVSVNDVYRVHMPALISTATNLNPQVGIRPAIHADEASLDRVCFEMGCGQALEVFTREYTSPYNNTVVRWMSGDRWVKFGADWSQSRNIKIDHKNGTRGIRCDAPGSYTAGNVLIYETD